MYMQSLSSSPLLPTVGWTCGECILAFSGALWKLPSTRDCSSVPDVACVCPLRCRSCEIVALAWLPSCWWPPRLNRWTRRRLGPGPDDGSGANIVSIMFILCCCVNVVVLNMSLYLLVLVLYM